jgi:hypothetical protein
VRLKQLLVLDGSQTDEHSINRDSGRPSCVVHGVPRALTKLKLPRGRRHKEAEMRVGDETHFTVTLHFNRRSETDAAESRDPASRTTFTRYSQSLKQDGEIFSIDEGMQIA